MHLPRNSAFKIYTKHPGINFANIKTISGHSDDPNIKSSSQTCRFGNLTYHLGNAFLLKNTTFRAPAISQNVTKYCTGHEKVDFQHVVIFSEIAGARNVVFFNGNASPRWDESGFRSSRCEMTILYSDVVGMSWNRLYIGESNVWIFIKNLVIRISCQAQYLVSSKGTLLTLCILTSFHGSSIWGSWKVTCIAPRIVSDFLYVPRINYKISLFYVLFSKQLFSKHLFSWHLFSKHLFSWYLFSQHLFFKHLSSKYLVSKHLFSNSFSIYSLILSASIL